MEVSVQSKDQPGVSALLGGPVQVLPQSDLLPGPWNSVVLRPLPMTRHQRFYTHVMQPIGALIIGTAISFGIHAGLYSKAQPDGLHMWHFPGCIAGDLAISALVSTILSWLVSTALQTGDVRAGRVQPWVPKQGSRWPADRTTRSGWFVRSHEMLWPPVPPLKYRRPRLGLFCENILRAAWLCVPMFLIFWTLAIIIMAPIWGTDDYCSNDECTGWPQLPIILGIFCGVISCCCAWISALCVLPSTGQRIDAARATGDGEVVPIGVLPATSVAVTAGQVTEEQIALMPGQPTALAQEDPRQSAVP